MCPRRRFPVRIAGIGLGSDSYILCENKSLNQMVLLDEPEDIQRLAVVIRLPDGRPAAALQWRPCGRINPMRMNERSVSVAVPLVRLVMAAGAAVMTVMPVEKRSLVQRQDHGQDYGQR